MGWHRCGAPTLKRTVPPGGNWQSPSSQHPPPKNTRSGPSIVAEGVINEERPRGSRTTQPPRVGIAQAAQACSSPLPGHLIPSRQKPDRDPFTSPFLVTRLRRVIVLAPTKHRDPTRLGSIKCRGTRGCAFPPKFPAPGHLRDLVGSSSRSKDPRERVVGKEKFRVRCVGYEERLARASRGECEKYGRNARMPRDSYGNSGFRAQTMHN